MLVKLRLFNFYFDKAYCHFPIQKRHFMINFSKYSYNANYCYFYF